MKSATVKSSKTVPQLSDSSDADIESKSKEDLEKHEKELAKELGKKVINWKAVEQLLRLTFIQEERGSLKLLGYMLFLKCSSNFLTLNMQKVVSDQPVVPICSMF